MNGETASTLNDESPLINQILCKVQELPKDKTHHFWQIIDSLAFKDTALVLLLSSFPKNNPANLDGATCRALLAQLWTLRQLIEAPEIMWKSLAHTGALEVNPSHNMDDLENKSNTSFRQD